MIFNITYNMKEYYKKNLTHDDLCVKQLLKAKGMTIAELAERIGMAREALSRVLSGGNPKYSTLAAVAEALGVSVPELFKIPEQDNQKDLYGVLVYKGEPFEINSQVDLHNLLQKIYDDSRVVLDKE